MADTKIHLSSGLKMAYATINNLNAMCRKISAAKAFLLVNRDRVRHEIDSLMQHLTSRLAVTHKNLEAEIAKLVKFKTEYLENWEQLIFQNICKIGEVCIETESALKTENERFVDRDAQRLIKQLQLLCQIELEPDSASFFENSVKIEFVPGIMEEVLENSTLGDLVTSGIESTGIENGNKTCCNEVIHQYDRKRFGMQNFTADKYTTQATRCSKCQHSAQGCQCALNTVQTNSEASNNVFQMKMSKQINKNEQLATTGPKVFVDRINNNSNCKNSQTAAIRYPIQQKIATPNCLPLEKPISANSWDTKHNTPSAYKSKSITLSDLSSQQNSISKNGIDWWEPKNLEKKVNNHLNTTNCDSSFNHSRATENMNVSRKLKNLVIDNWGPMNIESETDKQEDIAVYEVSSDGTEVHSSHKDEVNLYDDRAKKLGTHRASDPKEASINTSVRECWDDLLDKEIINKDEHELKSVDVVKSTNSVQEQAESNTNNKESHENFLLVSEHKTNCGASDCEQNELDDSFTSRLVKEATKKINSEVKKPIISGSVKNALKKHIQSNNNTPSAQQMGESKILDDSTDKTIDLFSNLCRSPVKIDAPKVTDSVSPATKKWRPYSPKKPPGIPEITDSLIKQEKPWSPIKSSGSSEVTASPASQENPLSPKKLPGISKLTDSPVKQDSPRSPVKLSSTPQMTYSLLKQEMSWGPRKYTGTPEMTLSPVKQEWPLSPLKPPGFPTMAGSPLKADKPWGPKNPALGEMPVHIVQPVMLNKKAPGIDISQLIGRGVHFRAIQTIQVAQIGVPKKGQKPFFQFPIGITVNHREEVIVCDNGAGLVRVFKFNSQIFSLSEGKDGEKLIHPSAVVVNDNDDIFVKDDRAIYVFDKRGNPINVIGKRCFKHPYGLVMTNEGNLVVLDVDKKRPTLFQFYQDGRIASCPLFGPLTVPKIGSKCRFLALYNNKILISDLGLSVMYLINLEGELLHRFGCLGTADGLFNQPSGITVDMAGNWIVADSRNDRIQVFKPNGDFLCHVKLPTPINRPSDIHLTPDGYLYVVNLLFHTVNVYKII